MSKIQIHAGDWGKNIKANFIMNTLQIDNPESSWRKITIPSSQIVLVETASEENVQRLGKSVGWGVAGVALLGPVGLLAGLAAGRGKNVTFVLQLKDGRKMLATANNKTFTKLTAITFA